MDLSERQRERYSRHLMLSAVGEAGQQRLLKGKVLIIGAGGLGSPAALYLAACGVGTIGLADGDRVDITNLQRQILHSTTDIGDHKVLSGKRRLEAVNDDITVVTHQLTVDSRTIRQLLAGYDFVIDATDNFAAKFLINDACVLTSTPYSHGGILEFNGQAMTILPGNSPCYRCLFPEPPPRELLLPCSRAGVIGVLPGIIGTLQATEAINYLLGIGEPLTGRLLTYNALTLRFREVSFQRSESCPVCGLNPTITELLPENYPLAG